MLGVEQWVSPPKLKWSRGHGGGGGMLDWSPHVLLTSQKLWKTVL